MFTRLGHLVVRRRRTVLVTTLLGLVVAIVLGSGVFARLTNGGFDDPNSLFRAFHRWTGTTPEAWRAKARIAE